MSEFNESAKHEFDKVASQYEQIHNQNLKFSGETSDFFVEHKVTELLRYWKTSGLSQEGKFLDFGCGIGRTQKYLKKYFPSLEYFGIDPSAESVRIAEQQSGITNWQVLKNQTLPYPDETFDCVFAACVFHHIRPSDRLVFYKEIFRILRPHGIFFVFEHNPLNPLTQYIVKTCEFDDDAVLLWPRTLKRDLKQEPFKKIDQNFVLFSPKKIRQLFPNLERSLSWLPLGAQFWTAARK